MRILMRGYDHPLEPRRVEDVLDEDLLGDLGAGARLGGSRLTGNKNSGNNIFNEAAYRTLATTDNQVDVSDFRGTFGDADRINDEYDAVVLPFANAFRPGFMPYLQQFTRLIKKLTVPVTVLGIGAQTDLGLSTEEVAAHESDVARFMSAVLDRGPSVGVRGEFTASYLARLGFRDVEVIGCPSMFTHGGTLPETVLPDGLDASSRISLNLTPGVRHPGLLSRHLDRYPLLDYVAQDWPDLRLMLWGDPVASEHDDEHPRDPWDRVFREDRARFFVDPTTWIDHLRGRDFVFGTRIHGNVAAILAGRPGHVVAHDSRTLEIAEYFEVPHTRLDSLAPDVDAADLLAASDYTAMHAGHAGRFERFRAYLDAHGVRHVHRPDTVARDVDAEIAALDLAAPVHAVTAGASAAVAERLSWLHARRSQGWREARQLRRDLQRLTRDHEQAVADLDTVRARLDALERAGRSAT